ncbi:ABC transporter substrate-binding protein [Kitasatospora sp. NPDC006697]|uniref:ABC transporter substrate-binding protein n=1 Tax=Kitasatospora sp. NPDC006697 TaxID=3364020 RepID=UPI0036CD108F
MRTPKTLAAVLLPVLALTACGSGGSPAKTAQGVDPGRDVVSQEKKVDTIAALLPPEVRAAGSVKVGAAFGSPPSAYYPDPGSKKAAGLDIDITDAVARVLGLTVNREDAAFDTILPALGSGKYDLGTGNFGVTTARLQTVDFVTYIDDGQGFAVKKDNSSLTAVTDLVQLCGLNIATGAGTTFESTLNAKKAACATAGKKPYTVQSYSDNGAVLTSLQQGRSDVEMSTINGLRYQAAQPAAGVKFLGEYHRLDVGFAFRKGTPLAPAFQAAVNQLIKDGTYQRILEKWGTAGSAIPASQTNPPEHS